MVWEYIDRSKLSPMMQHYVQIKEQHPDCLILYRLGDFYELFFDDALVGSRVLELTLTGRDCGLDERCPMAGVPHHVVDSYTAKLVHAGYKVCLVEQMEDPKKAVGLVKRGITRIVTPGTVTDAENLDRSEHNYLLLVYAYRQTLGLCYVDLSTGRLDATEIAPVKRWGMTVLDWVESLQPSEVILLDDEENQETNDAVQNFLSGRKLFLSRKQRGTIHIRDIHQGLSERLPGGVPSVFRRHLVAQIALYSLLETIYAYQDSPLEHLSSVNWVTPHRYLRLNAATRENLELTRNLEDATRRHTLLSVLDRTKTAMGSRKLADWLAFPLLDLQTIQARLDVVECFVHDLSSRLLLREALDNVYDLERLLSKLSFRRGNARDLLRFAQSLSTLPQVISTLSSLQEPCVALLLEGLDPLTALREHILSAIVDEPPIAVNEGGMIRDGYSKELDDLKCGGDEARSALVAYEEQERQRSGIRNLRIIFRKNQGYFIEVTRSNLDKIPDDYQRRQTLKNAERYSTPYLEMQANRIIGSSAQVEAMEFALFEALREEVATEAVRIQRVADTLADLDALLSLAQVADDYDYVRPEFVSEVDPIQIVEGRHPVVSAQPNVDFIPNDLDIGEDNNRIQVITGPNMAGKSTYIRQNALLIVMAQMGSFVPAKSCRLPIVDQIFTRIGARDHLAKGESTFMVEMKEMADILHEATENSFLVLDEVGRGTSTNDGLSIACAILEYLSHTLPAKTLFATHYHELTELADVLPNLSNRRVQIEEEAGELVFLHRVEEGAADRSYGIEVARLSGMPETILTRANALLLHLDQQKIESTPQEGVVLRSSLSFVGKDTVLPCTGEEKIAMNQENPVVKKLRTLDINTLSPLEAFMELDALIREAKQEGDNA